MNMHDDDKCDIDNECDNHDDDDDDEDDDDE